MNNPNEPTACKKCGSIYFVEMPAQMYTTGSYGVRAVSVTAMKVYMCPCGELLVPPGLNNGNQAGGERDLFSQSLNVALEYRAENGVDAAARGFAGIQELQALQAEVQELRDLLARRGPDPTAPLVDEGDESADIADGVQGATIDDTGEPTNRSEMASQPPIPSANRGRSMAAATEAAGDTKFLETPSRVQGEGGARGRMRRQGLGS
jgi:hypothetical protein